MLKCLGKVEYGKSDGVSFGDFVDSYLFKRRERIFSDPINIRVRCFNDYEKEGRRFVMMKSMLIMVDNQADLFSKFCL